MDHSSEQIEKYQVGEYIVDLNAATVTTPSGEVRILQEKAITTLAILMRSPGKYFNNEVLIAQIYTRVSISTNTIAKHIQQLRDAFDDIDKTVIVNRSKVGYALTLEVTPITEHTIEAAETAGRGSEPSFLKRFLGFVATVIGLAVVIWHLPQHVPEVAQVIDQRPLTHTKGQEYFPSLSTNGQWLLYSHRRGSKDWSLKIRHMNEQNSRTLLEQTGVSFKHAYLTDDNHRLLFTQISDEECALMEGRFDPELIELSHIRRIYTCDPSSKGARVIEGRNPDQYIFNDGTAIDLPYSLQMFSTITGRSEALTAPPATGRGDYYMSLSPDKNRIAFLRNVEDYVTEIRMLDLDKRNDQFLRSINTTLFSVRWSADGQTLIFKNANNQVVSFNWQTGEERVLKQARFLIYAPFPLGDNSDRIGVIAGSLIDKDIVSKNLDTQQDHEVVDSSFVDTMPIYSPIANRLAWISDRSGLFQVWIKSAEQPARQLTELTRAGRFTSLDFSLDGQKIGGTFQGQWFVYDLNAEQIKWSRTPERHYSNFAWQADNRSAYILESFERESIMKNLDVSEGITSRYSQFPDASLVKLSPDGKWLYAWFKQTHRFVRVDLTTNQTVQISTTNQAATTNQWAISNEGIIWVEQTAGKDPKLYQLSHQSTEPELLWEQSYFGNISISDRFDELILTKRAFGDTELIEI